MNALSLEEDTKIDTVNHAQRKFVYFDDRWCGDHGIGRFATEMKHRIPDLINLRILGPKLSIFDPVASSLALANCKVGCFFSPGFNPPMRSPIPTVFTIHDLIHLKIPEESTALRRLYYASVVLPAIRSGATVLTVSEHSRKDILEWAGVNEEQVHVVGCGASPVFTCAVAPADRRPFLLHVGRRAGYKNIARLIQAFSPIAKRTKLQLVFTGAPDKATIACAVASDAAEKIRFTGPLSDESLAHLYQEALALVFPSLYEGFGLPIIEAMACGTPVITSRAASMLEVAGPDNALFVDPYSIEEISHAIELLVHDSELQRKYSMAGLMRAQQFTWEKVATKVNNLLETISS